jgi:electron transfer flavoprotein alpha subunit
MALLLIAEHDNEALRDASTKTLTAALQVSEDIDVLVATAMGRCSSARWPSPWRRWWCP